MTRAELEREIKEALERGYSVITDESGKPVSKITKAKKLLIRTSKQEISATADEVRDIK